MYMRGKSKFSLLAIPLLAILFLSQILIIPEAKGITVYQSFQNEGLLNGWSSISDVWQSSFTNYWIFYNYEPYHTAFPSLSPSGGTNSQPIGYLRKTFTSTNSTNFTWLNITAWYRVANVINDQPNIMIGLNDRLLFGDCYPSNNWTYQNNRMGLAWSKTGSVFTNFETPYQFNIAQPGFDIYHYTGDWNPLVTSAADWHKLSINLAQTNTSYTFTYYYDNQLVLDRVTWGLAYFTQPLECYDIKLYLGRETWIDDISIDYRYQTTPISTVNFDLWYLSYLFAPNENPLIANRSYILNMHSTYGGYGITTLLSLTIEGVHVGNFTTDPNGMYSLPIVFPNVGAFDIYIEAYYGGALVKTLSDTFVVSTYTPVSPISWTLQTLMSIIVPAVVVGIVGYGVSGLFDQFDHGTAGFFIGAAMGFVIVTNSGLVPMWFFTLVFILGSLGVLYYMRN